MSGRIIPALLEHKFDVSQIEAMGSNKAHSPVMSVVHNGVCLSFELMVQADDASEERRIGHMGLYVQYVRGPTDVLTKMNFVLFVAKGPQRAPAGLLYETQHEFTSIFKALYSDWGSVTALPNTLETLRSEGYLCRDSMLHAFAILLIPESAFEDPSHTSPASTAQNPFFHHLFGEIGTPTATNPPLSNRFEFISCDGDHFWVHKDVLAFNSDAFAQMFDPNKPENARFKYLREGTITLENISGGALREMLSFIYLKHTTPDFNQFAMELVPIAEMYQLNGLRLLCHQTLIDLTKKEKDIDELLRIVDVSRLHNLSVLEIACVSALEQLMEAQNLDRELTLKVSKEAHEHRYDELQSVCQQKLIHHVKECANMTVPIIQELAAEAKNYCLSDLLAACDQWLGTEGSAE